MSNPVIIYILECEHVQPGRSGVIEIKCYNCDMQVRKVIDVHVYEWRVYCKTCNYRPWCGLSQMTANHHARGHTQKRPHHEAKVLYMKNPLAERVQSLIKEGRYNAPSPGKPKTA